MAVSSQAAKKERITMVVPSPEVKKEAVSMAGPSQAVSETERVKGRITWDCIKLHLTFDKIIVFIIIAILWMLSTVPLLAFYSTPSGAVQSQVSQCMVEQSG